MFPAGVKAPNSVTGRVSEATRALAGALLAGGVLDAFMPWRILLEELGRHRLAPLGLGARLGNCRANRAPHNCDKPNGGQGTESFHFHLPPYHTPSAINLAPCR